MATGAPDGRCPPEATAALKAFEAAQERLLDVETDLALVDDEARRIRKLGAERLKSLLRTEAPLDDVQAARDTTDATLAETHGRADLLRSRAAHHALEREACLLTVGLCVAAARDDAPDLVVRFEKLARLNGEVAQSN